MTKKPVYITDTDMRRLLKLLGDMKCRTCETAYPERLIEEMERALVIPAEKLHADVVTLNTRMRVKDLDSGEVASLQLVFPDDEDFEHGKISVLTPIGGALIGHSKGDMAEWKIPTGIRRLRIEEITYQPESDGLY